MATTTLTHTVQKILDDYPPGMAEKALRKALLGAVLADIATPVEEALVANASLEVTLTKVPIGPVVCAFTEAANHVPLTQMPLSELGNLAATEFCVDPSTRKLTAGGTVADTEELTVVYTGLTAAADGTGSKLADTLASDYED